MQLRNRSRYPALGFEAVDHHGEIFHVVVARVTMSINSAEVLHIADEQQPLVFTDKLYGDLGHSSIKEESDLAPFKPKCDVVVIGNALVPDGSEARRFEAGIAIRRHGTVVLDKRIRVTGPRKWKKSLLPFAPWDLSEPEPVRSVPIRYEYAYGGECRINPDDPAAERVPKKYRLTLEQRAAHPDGAEKAPIAHTCSAANTVGRGFIEDWYLSANRLSHISAPQIESVHDPIKTFGKPYAPQGLGFLAKSSASRIPLAGTMDDAFIKSGKSLPIDFDFAFWNGAPQDMQIPWLEGNEEITLINIEGADRFFLPEHQLCAKIIYSDRQMAGLDFNIDTLVINADEKIVNLVYRLKLPTSPKIMSLEILESSSQVRAKECARFQAFNQQLCEYEEIHHG